MNDMEDLLTRLRAAIDEAERVALAASPGPWSTDAEANEVLAADGIMVADVFALSGQQLCATAEHIVHTCPDRTLRMVAAHRKILDLHKAYGNIKACTGCGLGAYGEDYNTEDVNDCPTLLALAEGYGIEA